MALPWLESAADLRLPQIGDGFDLDQRFRASQRSHFNQGRSRKVAGEELAARAPDLGVVLDVDQEDGHLDEIFQAAAGGFAHVFDTREDLPRLLVLVAAYQRLAAFEWTSHLTGDEKHVSGANAVRP